MRFKRWAWLLFLLVLPLLAVACGDEEGGGPAGRDITADDLASLVLTREELGDKFANLSSFPEDSVSISNERFIADAEDPEDARAHIEEFRRVAGYESVFQGDALIADQLALYETAEGASNALVDMLQEAGTGQERQIELEEFDVGDIGDETHGIVGRTPEGPNFTFVAVRMDRLGILVAMVVSPMSPLAVEDEMQEDVRQLAQRQVEKIEAASQS